MIKRITQNGKAEYGLKSYLADTVADLTPPPQAATGSTAFCLEDGMYYILDSKGAWVMVGAIAERWWGQI